MLQSVVRHTNVGLKHRDNGGWHGGSGHGKVFGNMATYK